MSLLVMMIYVWNMTINLSMLIFRSSVNALFLSNPFCLILSKTYLTMCLGKDGLHPRFRISDGSWRWRQPAQSTTTTARRASTIMGRYTSEGQSPSSGNSASDGKNGTAQGEHASQSARHSTTTASWVSWFCANQPTHLF